MRELPEVWTPDGPDHAVRIHESLVEQGEKLEHGVTAGPWRCSPPLKGLPKWPLSVPEGKVPDKRLKAGFRWDPLHGYCEEEMTLEDVRFIVGSRALIPALVEESRTLLKTCERLRDLEGERWGHLQARAVNDSVDEILEATASGLAPKMIAAGMEVPE